MGFFSSKKEEKVASQPKAKVQDNTEVASHDIIKIPTNNVSIIKERFKVQANIEGDGSLIVGGQLDGNIKIDDTLFIEKGAKFKGKVEAKNVKISGDFEGNIEANSVEITKSGRLNGSIKANKTFLGGFVDGIIRSMDSVEIFSTGIIDTKECKSKQIKINGKVEGRVVASELLEVTSGGSVNGDIITKGIRTEQGGSIIGNIQTYDESLHGEDVVIEKEADEVHIDIDPEVAKLINVKPEDMKKYAKKDDPKSIKRIPENKKS
jgi:cytoskeletal protein CcmA (bactofilin family)